jgi:aspartate carbamoyltransferase catalytic subunit
MSDEVEQLNSRGELRHLINLGGLDRAHLEEIIDLATRYLTPVGAPAPRDDILRGRTVANLFFEPSTRTRASFELAAKRLRADVLNLDVNMSSRAKGESIMDTIYTLQAMQVDIFVVRDASTGVPARIAQQVAPHVCVLNAGESDASHPTQGLLDLMTIQRHKGDVRDVCVAIIATSSIRASRARLTRRSPSSASESCGSSGRRSSCPRTTCFRARSA